MFKQKAFSNISINRRRRGLDGGELKGGGTCLTGRSEKVSESCTWRVIIRKKKNQVNL